MLHPLGSVASRAAHHIALIVEDKRGKRLGLIYVLGRSDQFDIGHLGRLVVAVTAVQGIGPASRKVPHRDTDQLAFQVF